VIVALGFMNAGNFDSLSSTVPELLIYFFLKNHLIEESCRTRNG